jgi:hypothetical protein
MRSEFESVLAEIKAMTPPTPLKVRDVIEPLWNARPDDEEEDALYDYKNEFIELCRSVWALSTCPDKALKEAFVMAENSGYPLFAGLHDVVEFDERVTHTVGSAFALYPWDEIRKLITWRSR